MASSGASANARRAHRQEWARESLWLWPAIAGVAAFVLAEVVVAANPSFVSNQGWFSAQIEDARVVLGTIAAAILTFIGVVFSITLVALQVASAQYSPRVVRTFVRKRITKLTLATFIATFVYSLTVLASLGTSSRGPNDVPAGAVGLAFVLVIACIFVFVFFVHSTVRSMRVTYVIEDVADESLRAIPSLYPDPGAPAASPVGPVPADPGQLLRFDHRGSVLDGVDTAELVRLAAEHGIVLELRAEVGSYLAWGDPFVVVHGGAPPSTAAILRGLNLSHERTIYQDVRYGIRQLVDIAIRALSPAVNDPTTGVQVIDRLADILGHLLDRSDPSGLAVDAAGVVRLVRPVPSWSRVVDLAFTEIARYGADSPQISRRLMAVYEVLLDRAGPDRAAVLEVHRDSLVAEVTRVTPDATLRSRALTPDPLGLG